MRGKLAGVGTGTEPTALLGAQVEVAGEFRAVGAGVHGHAPVLLGGATEEFQRQLAAPDGGKIPLTVHVHGLAQVVGQIVFIEVQFGAVDEIHARGEYGVLFLQEGMEKLRRHRRFNAHARQVLFGDGHVSEHAVGAIRGPEVEAQFVQPGAGKGAQVFLVCADAVGVHVLVDAGGVEFGDDVVVDLDLHERFEVDVGDARRRAVDGEQKFDVLRAKARAADLPQGPRQWAVCGRARRNRSRICSMRRTCWSCARRSAPCPAGNCGSRWEIFLPGRRNPCGHGAT